MLQERTSRLICLVLGAISLLAFLCFTRLLGPYVSLNPSSLTIMLVVFSLSLFLGSLISEYASSHKGDSGSALLLLSLSGFALFMSLLLNDLLLPHFMYTMNTSVSNWVGSILIIFPVMLLLTASMRCLFLIDNDGSAHSLVLYTCAGLIIGAITAHVLTHTLMSIRSIILGLGCCTIFLSGFIFIRMRQHIILSILSITISLSFSIYYSTSMHHLSTLPNLVYLSATMNGQMMIYDSLYNRLPARLLTHDRAIIDVAHLPEYGPILEQHDYSLLLDTKLSKPQRILVLGLGAAVLPNALASRYIDSNISVTANTFNQPYDEALLFQPLRANLAFLNHSPRASLSLTEKPYDVVIMNESLSKEANNDFLSTTDFYHKVHERLNDEGWFICPMEGQLSNKHKNPLYTQIATLGAVFKNVSVFATQSRGYTHRQTFVAFASKTLLPLSKMSDHPKFHDLRERLLHIDPLELAQYSLHTDDAHVTF